MWRTVVSFLLFSIIVLSSPAQARESTAVPLLLAKVYGWESNQDPTQYWVSEKYDGVRAYWDGEQLKFRSGHPIASPAWFVTGLPKVRLDGELWMGRGSFQRLVGIVRKKAPIEDEWREVRFMVFELPGASGTFTARIAQIKRIVDQTHLPWVHAVPQTRVSGNQELKKRLTEVVASGGEGLMLHRAEALYHGGRSSDLLKVKLWLDDEAKVVGHRPGTGKYLGMMGAMEVETAAGLRFLIGTGFTDAERREPPVVGSVITYRYTGLTKGGLPRFPAFLRIRQEL
ncbi:MAG: DNA ligase [Proteobacteria bacterium]|nr:DNA ligase [Desulfobulbaceae bacterium]MBU4152338.1 DNA ligase [Pseudomonadota bacterium]